MKKLWYMFALALVLFPLTSCDEDPVDNGPVEIPKDYEITGSTDITTLEDYDAATKTLTLKKINNYTFEGLVYILSGTTLKIERGSVVKVKEVAGDGTSAIIITRGAKIMAEGTADEPIIFTSDLDDVDNPSDLSGTDNQLWGGLVLLGRAPVFADGINEQYIEGIDHNPNSQYGGSDPNDNSGIVRYVSIRHTGAELSPGNEIQGLTLGGVGAGTTIEYVESFASSDDGIEIFGGTVNVKYFAVSFSEDDCFDLDLGWRGKGQFWFAMKGPKGNTNGEWDGAVPDDADLYTNGKIYNATLIGSNDAGNTDNTLAVQMRDGFGGVLANSIIMETVGLGIEVEDIAASKDGMGRDSYSKMVKGELKLLNNIWWVGDRSEISVDPSKGIIKVTSGGDDPTAAQLIAHMNSSNNIVANPLINVSRNAGSKGLNPKPGNTGLVTSNVAPVPDAWYTNVGFRGAFDPSASGTWMDGWTALSQNGYLAD